MTDNEKKAKEIGNIMLELANYSSYNTPDEQRNNIRNVAEQAALKMAEWKDKQSNKWHKAVDGDLPEKGGNYWCKLKGEYDQGSSHYKQHCNNGYCILQWLPKKKAWNVRYNTEVEAWIELPKYMEE